MRVKSGAVARRLHRGLVACCLFYNAIGETERQRDAGFRAVFFFFGVFDNYCGLWGEILQSYRIILKCVIRKGFVQ